MPSMYAFLDGALGPLSWKEKIQRLFLRRPRCTYWMARKTIDRARFLLEILREHDLHGLLEAAKIRSGVGQDVAEALNEVLCKALCQALMRMTMRVFGKRCRCIVWR